MNNLFFKALLFTLMTTIFISCEDEEIIEESLVTSVTFWSDFSGPPISVSITGVGSGSVTTIGSSTPDCFEQGNFTRSLGPGTYSYTASDGNLTWSNGSFTISGNSTCTTVLLTD